MPVKDSIKRARLNNVIDVDILEEVKKQNPQATSYFRRKEDLGWSAEQILDDLSKEESFFTKAFFAKLSLSIATAFVFFSLSCIVFLGLRDAGYIFQGRVVMEEDADFQEAVNNSDLATSSKEDENKEEDNKEVAGKESARESSNSEDFSFTDVVAPLIIEEDYSLPFNESFDLPILMYHHIRDLPDNASKEWRDLTVSPGVFREQMEYLYQEGYQTINFIQLAQLIDNNTAVSEKHIIITFDDGWLNQYNNAFPVLQEYDFIATFFVVGNYINGSSFVSQDQIKEMIERGMEIGSHTMSHPNLNQVSDAQLIHEVRGSKDFLEKMFGVEIVSFAYPYGAVSKIVLDSTKEAGYRFARSVNSGIDQNLNRLYNLKTLHATDDVDAFKKLLSR